MSLHRIRASYWLAGAFYTHTLTVPAFNADHAKRLVLDAVVRLFLDVKDVSAVAV